MHLQLQLLTLVLGDENWRNKAMRLELIWRKHHLVGGLQQKLVLNGRCDCRLRASEIGGVDSQDVEVIQSFSNFA